jgi:hypothetical protein
MKMVGPGYTSLGAPNISTDQLGFEGRVDQQFLDRRVSVGISARQFRDNLISWKSSTTTTTAYGADIGITFPQLPFLRLTYAPCFQKNDDPDRARQVDNTMAISSVMAGYSFLVGSLNSSTSFAFTRQQTETTDGIADCRTNSYTLTEGVSFSFPLTLTANLGLNQLFSGVGYGRTNTLEFAASASPISTVSATMGINLAVEKDRNKKTGLYVGSNVSLFQIVTIDLRAEQNVYSEEQVTSGDYREFIFSGTLTARW